MACSIQELMSSPCDGAARGGISCSPRTNITSSEQRTESGLKESRVYLRQKLEKVTPQKSSEETKTAVCYVGGYRGLNLGPGHQNGSKTQDV